MPVQIAETGARWVRIETEVPGAPETVWDAVATGPGVSAWFVRTEVRDDGTIVSDFGPGMESVARITHWDPPRRFTAESADLGPEAPPIVTEWAVAPAGDGRCRVSVTHRVAVEGTEWDSHLENWESGWPWFLRILDAYLAHFAGEPCVSFRVMGTASEPAETAWAAFAEALDLTGAAAGQAWHTDKAPVPHGGTILATESADQSWAVLIRLDAPDPGLLSAFALPMGGQVFLIMDFYLYGPNAASTADAAAAQWREWMVPRFPPPAS